MLGGERLSHEVRNYESGITRKEINGEYQYFYIKNNQKISDTDLKRIENLKIPPAWNDVWISSEKNAKIQAIGTDTKGRKQYIYHATHIKQAEKKKFARLYKFIQKIPQLENILEKHEKLPVFSKTRVIATMLFLVKELFLRVGKEQYARANKSYGVSSLKKKHLKIMDGLVKLNFRGKSKKKVSYTIHEKKIINHLKTLMTLKNPKKDYLFQYIDEHKIKKITDKDLNDYIKQYMGREFTAKDFRTYAANYHFIRALINETKKHVPINQKILRRNIRNAIRITAHYLRHTKAISKKSYIMNFCINLYENDPQWFVDRNDQDPTKILMEILKMYKKMIL